nr:TonB-dependent receptor [Rhodothermus marinus]
MRRISLLLLCLLVWPLAGYAQGVTTAALTGTVTDEQGNPLPGANIVVVHEPTGTQYGTTTQIDGRYTLLNLKPGGPYTITVSFIGYQPQRETDVILPLGQTRTLNFALRETTVELETLEVVAERNSVLNSDRTGASTNLDETTIERVPTITRSLADLTRLTPQASGGFSLAGRNNRYNNIQIDGATLNDVFGLSATGMPGGQAGAQPISLDAIQELNVDIAPYDVRKSGFTGGAINAVTKSGTNRFSGSVRFLDGTRTLLGISRPPMAKASPSVTFRSTPWSPT